MKVVARIRCEEFDATASENATLPSRIADETSRAAPSPPNRWPTSAYPKPRLLGHRFGGEGTVMPRNTCWARPLGPFDSPGTGCLVGQRHFGPGASAQLPVPCQASPMALTLNHA